MAQLFIYFLSRNGRGEGQNPVACFEEDLFTKKSTKIHSTRQGMAAHGGAKSKVKENQDTNKNYNQDYEMTNNEDKDY